MFIRSFVAAAAFGLAGIIFAPIATAAPYPNCSAAKADGVCNIPSSSEYYQPKLDRDQDGVGCEC